MYIVIVITTIVFIIICVSILLIVIINTAYFGGIYTIFVGATSRVGAEVQRCHGV